MKTFETMQDAQRVARDVLNGTINPYMGCGLTGGIGQKLNHHPTQMEFIHIAHLLDWHEHVGFTKESLLSDIMFECSELTALQA